MTTTSVVCVSVSLCVVDAAVEEDEFHGYRDNLCADALSAVFEELGATYVEFLGRMLEHATASPDWIPIEVVLYATRAVHLAVCVVCACGARPPIN